MSHARTPRLPPYAVVEHHLGTWAVSRAGGVGDVGSGSRSGTQAKCFSSAHRHYVAYLSVFVTSCSDTTGEVNSFPFTIIMYLRLLIHSSSSISTSSRGSCVCLSRIACFSGCSPPFSHWLRSNTTCFSCYSSRFSHSLTYILYAT